jgi:hypothetical protein
LSLDDYAVHLREISAVTPAYVVSIIHQQHDSYFQRNPIYQPVSVKSENEKKDELKLQAFCTEPTSLLCCLHGHGIKEKYPWILIPGVDGGILLPAQKRFEPLPGAGGSFSTEATFLLGHLHGHGRLGPLSGTRGKEC